MNGQAKADLPRAWRAATQYCPWCSGQGTRDEEPCVRCDSTGDLFGAMLFMAYRAGRDAVIGQLEEVGRTTELALKYAKDEQRTVEQLKWRAGL